MHILFVSATRIGDAVLSTGLLSHLVERYPDARFTIELKTDPRHPNWTVPPEVLVRADDVIE